MSNKFTDLRLATLAFITIALAGFALRFLAPDKKSTSSSSPNSVPEIRSTSPSANPWWDYPETIVSADVSGDRFLILVDKAHRLPPDYVPGDLATITSDVIRTKKEIQVVRALLEPLRALAEKARRDGVDLSVISGYRSYQRQEELYTSYVRARNGDRAATDQFSARPGHSEHQLGTVIDFSTSEIADGIGDHFHRTSANAWLLANAPAFDFRLSYPAGKERETHYMHEGWHWRYYPPATP